MIRFLIILLLVFNLYGYNVRKYIPKNAYIYYPQLIEETFTHFNGFPYPAYFGSLVEHESCVSLKSKRCWSPRSQLYTRWKNGIHREQGVGFGQITRAWRSNGRLRFDALKELKRKHKSLRELTWANIKSKPRLQLRAIVLKWRDNYNRLSMIRSIWQRTAFADAAYNGGLYGVYRDRRLCGLKNGCNPQIWFEQVEYTCSKSHKPLYAGRSPCDINRHHVIDVMLIRYRKYYELLRKMMRPR